MSSGGLLVPSDLSTISVNVPSSAPAFIPFLGRSQASLGFLLTPGFFRPEGPVFRWDASYLQHSTVFVFVLTAIKTTENYSHEASEVSRPAGGFWEVSGKDHISDSCPHHPSCCSPSPRWLLCSRRPTPFPVHYASPTPRGREFLRLGCQLAATLWKLTRGD